MYQQQPGLPLRLNLLSVKGGRGEENDYTEKSPEEVGTSNADKMGAGKLLGLRAVAVGKVGHGPPVGEGKALAPKNKRNNKAHTKTRRVSERSWCSWSYL